MADADTRRQFDERPSTADSLREYGRGLAGGLLFSLPLLYTMEVWWTGFLASPMRLLSLLAVTYVLLLGYNRFAGLRHDASWLEVAVDSVEELGLGLVTSAGVLFLLGRIGGAMAAREVLGKIVVEAALVAIGFSVGSAQLGTRTDDRGKGDEEEADRSSLANDVVIALCGAVLFAANVAPTEEIVLIAIETDVGRLLGVVAFSIVLSAGVLYFVDFADADRLAPVRTKLDVVIGASVPYAISLVAAAAILWFFGRFEGVGLDMCVRQTVVLAFPASLGAAAGRLLLQS